MWHAWGNCFQLIVFKIEIKTFLGNISLPAFVLWEFHLYSCTPACKKILIKFKLDHRVVLHAGPCAAHSSNCWTPRQFPSVTSVYTNEWNEGWKGKERRPSGGKIYIQSRSNSYISWKYWKWHTIYTCDINLFFSMHLFSILIFFWPNE